MIPWLRPWWLLTMSTAVCVCVCVCACCVVEAAMASLVDRCDMTFFDDAPNEKTWHSLTDLPALNLIDEVMTNDLGYVDEIDFNKGIRRRITLAASLVHGLSERRRQNLVRGGLS